MEISIRVDPKKILLNNTYNISKYKFLNNYLVKRSLPSSAAMAASGCLSLRNSPPLPCSRGRIASHGVTLFASSLLLPLNPAAADIASSRRRRSLNLFSPNCVASRVSTMQEQVVVEVAKGLTMAQFCDKMIEYFMHEKPQTKEWRKLLVFRDEWKKYKDAFFKQCELRIDAENDKEIKQKLVMLSRKIKKVNDEIEGHVDLLKEIYDNPMDINAVVARRRKDFTGDFFRYLTVLSDSHDSLEDRDASVRLGAKCLSAISAYDNVIEQLDTLDSAQSKFDDILNFPSLDMACEKIRSLAKAKELNSSLILLINASWAAAKESKTISDEAKHIMCQIYKTTSKSVRSMAPREIKLLKYLLNISDPEERFSALATAFSPSSENEMKDDNAMYTTPKELHKWIKIMLDAHQLNKQETELMEARQMSDPIVIQRLFILKETIEQDYMNQQNKGNKSGAEQNEDENDNNDDGGN